MISRVCFFTFVLVCLFGLCTQTSVLVETSKNVNTSIRDDTIEAIKRAYMYFGSEFDRCNLVRQIMLEKYPDFEWQVVTYHAFSIKCVKFLNLKVNNQTNYLVFATNP